MKFCFGRNLILRAVLSGGLGALSVFGWGPVAFFSCLPLIYGALYYGVLTCKSARSVAFIALSFGVGQHAVGHGWAFGALHWKLGLSYVFALFGTTVFVLYLAAFLVVPVVVWACFWRNTCQAGDWLEVNQARAFSLAAFLTFGEWSRSELFNGITSLSAGYAWVDTPLASIFPLFGVFGASLVFFGVSFGVVESLVFAKTRLKKHVTAWAVGTVGIVLAVFGLSAVDWVQPAGASLRYRLIQYNIRQEQKFDRDFLPKEIAALADLMTEQESDLVVAPETAFPMYFHELPENILAKLRRFASTSGTHLLVGVATIGSQTRGYNSVMNVAPYEPYLSFINKSLLMPFGEYEPPGFGWFSQALDLPLKNLSPGAFEQFPFSVRGVGIGTMICQEDLSSTMARAWAPKVGLLINPSNLAWFERSFAIPQRIQIVQARALEVGRPVLRVANTGITAHIDHRGRILQQTAPDVFDVLVGEVRPMQGRTPYARYGDWPLLFFCLAALISMGKFRICFWAGARAATGSVR